MQTPDSPLAPGLQCVGGYAVEAPLGEAVFIVRAPGRPGGRAVLALLPAATPPEPEARAAFDLDADALGRLVHPAIAPLVGRGTHEGRPFVVTALAPGRALPALLAERGPLPAAFAVAVLQQAADALASAHAGGLLHRDLRAAAVVVDDAATPPAATLVGFGLGRRSAWGAPDARAWDARCDLHALGLVAAAMLGAGTEALAAAVAPAAGPADGPALPPGTPRALAAIVGALLQPDPARRYASAAALADDLRALQRGDDTPRPPSLERGRDGTGAPAFVGRAAERRRLDDAWRHAHDGLQLFGLAGPAGIGKSRLLAEVARGWPASTVLVGQGRPPGHAVPWGLVADALATLAGHRAARAGSSALREAAGADGALLRALVPALVPALLPVRDPAQEAVQEAAQVPPLPLPEQRPHHVAALFVRVLQALCRVGAPAVLVFDDLQWADEASLDFLATLVRRAPGARLLVLLAWCDDAPPADARLARALDRLRALAPLPCATLGPLDEAAARALVASMLGPVVPAAADALVARAAGHPLQAVEQLRALVADGGLCRGDAGWTVDADRPAAAARDAEPLAQTVSRRLAHLDAPTREVLAIAAVAGRVVAPATLRRLLVRTAGVGRDAAARRVVEALDAAQRAGLLCPAAGGVAWSHAVLREAQYAATGAPVRQALHRACAELLAVFGRPADAAALAHHAGLAGDAAAAFAAARRAGDAALRDGAPDDALAFYAQARRHGLALPPPARDAGDAGLAHAVVDAQLAAGRLGAARHAFEPLWSRPGDPVALGETARAYAALLRRHGEAAPALAIAAAALGRLGEHVPCSGWPLARQLVVEGLRRLRDERRPPAVGAAEAGPPSRRGALLGELYALLTPMLLRVDPLQAFGAQLRACNLVERDGDLPARSRAAAAHGALCGLLSMSTRALRLLSGAAAAQRSLGDERALAHTLGQRLLPLLMQARWDECVEDGHRAADAFERLDAPLERAMALRGLHYALAACGRWDEADAVHAALQRQTGRPGQRPSGAWSVVLRADLPARHDASQLLADARAAAALRAGRDDPLAQAALRRAEGRAATLLGRCAEAAAAFDAARALVLRHRLRVLPVADVLLDRVEGLQRRAGGPDAPPAGAVACREAARALREARLLLAGIPALVPWLLRLRAAQCRLQGRLAAAQTLWRRALAAACENGMPLQRGLALLAWGLALQQASPSRSARLLAEAAEVLDRLGVHAPARPPRPLAGRAAEKAPACEAAGEAALAAIARRLVEQPDADTLLAAAAEAALQLLNAERAIVFVREGAGGAVRRRAEAGGDAARGAAVASAVVDHVFAGAGGAILAEAGKPARTVLCVPLPEGGGVDGVLYVDRVDRASASGRSGAPELARLQALAALTAPLLRRLRSLAAARAEQARLQARVDAQDAALVQAHGAAAAAEQALQAYLSGLGHEIRTPMHAIFGMTHLMMQTGLTPRQADCMHKLDRSAQLLLGLFDHAKHEAGGAEVESVPFTLPEVLDPLLAVAGPAADAKGLRLVLALAPALPSRLIGDPLRLTQVLFNLVGNALAFTEHGEVVVELHDRPVGAGHHRLHVVVQDSGRGIRPALRAQLFEPWPAGAGGRGGPRGQGGLALSRQFVRQMGGDLECRSEPGVGSRFAFDVAVLAEAGPASWPLQGCRVLLLADHGPTQRAIAGMLQGLGAWSVACAALADALQQLAAQGDGPGFDAVVVDLALPAAALAPLAASAGRPPVLVYGAAPAGSASSGSAGAGAWTVLARPATPWTLRRALEAARPASAAAPAAPGPAQRPLHGLRVLLVEDNEINRDFAVEVLGEAGVHVSTAEDGAQALVRLAEQPFDLVLMDCQMPVMDGYEATRRLRETPRWQALPVVAMTAFAMRGDRERALAAGMTDVITKPVRVPQLLALLARRAGRDAAGAQSSAQPASGPASTGPTTSGAGIA